MSPPKRRATLGLHLVACLFFAVVLCSGRDVIAGGLATREEALAAGLPGAQIKPERIFLTGQQIEEAAAVAGVPIASALVARYQALLNWKLGACVDVGQQVD